MDGVKILRRESIRIVIGMISVLEMKIVICFSSSLRKKKFELAFIFTKRHIFNTWIKENSIRKSLWFFIWMVHEQKNEYSEKDFYSADVDVQNIALYETHFNWFIAHFDWVKNALEEIE